MMLEELRVDNLSVCTYEEHICPQDMTSDVKHFLAQTVDYKESLQTTKVRICWDASRESHSQKSLNLYFREGLMNFDVQKTLFYFWKNKLVTSADISKFYNSVKLDQSDWPLHLAL